MARFIDYYNLITVQEADSQADKASFSCPHRWPCRSCRQLAITSLLDTSNMSPTCPLGTRANPKRLRLAGAHGTRRYISIVSISTPYQRCHCV